MHNRLAVLAGAAVIGVGTLAGTSSAATHLSGHFTFPDTVCGIAVQHEVSFIDNFGSQPDGAHFDAGQIVETFTAANGRGVTITFTAGLNKFAAPVQNPDGTTTWVITASGLDVKTQAVGGPVLEQGAGLVQVTLIFDAQGNLLSISAVALAGPNPNLTGAPDCAVVGPYLAGA
jgi:hypothetical protein